MAGKVTAASIIQAKVSAATRKSDRETPLSSITKGNVALRLFDGSGGTVTYEGRFEIDEMLPFYYTDAPETNDGPTRSVIVFRLRPIDATQHGPVTGDPPTKSLLVNNVPIEQQHTETFFVNPRSEATEADRREAKLVRAFCAFVTKELGFIPTRKQILPPGEVKPLFTDVFIEEINLLIEAKGTTERGAFRMALGQIADYRRFLNSPLRNTVGIATATGLIRACKDRGHSHSMAVRRFMRRNNGVMVVTLWKHNVRSGSFADGRVSDASLGTID